MHIDSKKLNEVAALMEDHGLTRVRLSEEDGRVVELERMTAPAPEAIAVPVAAPMTAAVTPAAAPAAPAVTAPTEAPAPAAETAPAPTASNTISVEAPMVGVFYAAPSPGADPFVSVGSTVHVGDTLCIIEAMKLMNEVVAEADGTVAEICVQDGDLVEFGSCIMKIVPGGEA
ncbi:MAG TPA: acetyl-CoA carboxylase biotin carboxyl carrier protein [Enorma massiliensis]|uniref:acetyl-CoA carboxylase biotin carboxyl carrier protein n=1 Tax=Enorma massiliensis TaxID=1472761 RepID=UPI001DDACEBC|nr:acetyl-CoA carboxylase biotin carboxyl carrier protein [Enorma massiliensis]HJG62416.1 acetyl-CoA carboxylase biotin carboxyl carrier protein [Enorma massiliensis]